MGDFGVWDASLRCSKLFFFAKAARRTLMIITPRRGQDLTTYKDQTAQFYSDPATYLSLYFPERVSRSFPPSLYPNTVPGQKETFSKGGRWQHEWPSHLVLFDNLLSMRLAVNQSAGGDKQAISEDVTSFRDVLVRLGYSEVWSSGWNGWEGDERRRGEVRIWQFSPDSPPYDS